VRTLLLALFGIFLLGSTPVEIEDESKIFMKILILRKKTSTNTAKRIAQEIAEQCREKELDPNTVLAIMYIESGFKWWVKGAQGDTGLMQVMPFWTSRGLCRGFYLRDIKQNIDCGTSIFANYLEMFDYDETLAITAYNRGETKVRRELARGRSPVQHYTHVIQSVKKYLEKIDRLGSEINRESRIHILPVSDYWWDVCKPFYDSRVDI